MTNSISLDIFGYIRGGNVPAPKNEGKQMGLNKIYLGDCRKFLKYLDGLDYIIVSDPPYNIGYDYDVYKDNLSEKDYFLMLRNVIGIKKPAVIIHFPEALHQLSIYLGEPPKRCISWVYNSNTARQHRDIAFYRISPDLRNVPGVYKNLNDPRIIERIKQGKCPKCYDWIYNEMIKIQTKEKYKLNHPCIIPLNLMDKIIKMLPKDKVIVDPFCGSGTTLLAAKKNNRRFLGFEISKKYFELANRRLIEETSQIELFNE